MPSARCPPPVSLHTVSAAFCLPYGFRRTYPTAQFPPHAAHTKVSTARSPQPSLCRTRFVVHYPACVATCVLQHVCHHVRPAIGYPLHDSCRQSDKNGRGNCKFNHTVYRLVLLGHRGSHAGVLLQWRGITRLYRDISLRRSFHIASLTHASLSNVQIRTRFRQVNPMRLNPSTLPGMFPW